jgi:hypothetical protein
MELKTRLTRIDRRTGSFRASLDRSGADGSGRRSARRFALKPLEILAGELEQRRWDHDAVAHEVMHRGTNGTVGS